MPDPVGEIMARSGQRYLAGRIESGRPPAHTRSSTGA